MGSGLRSSSALAARIIPGMQMPHCTPPFSMKASCSGCSRPASARPSIVSHGARRPPGRPSSGRSPRPGRPRSPCRRRTRPCRSLPSRPSGAGPRAGRRAGAGPLRTRRRTGRRFTVNARSMTLSHCSPPPPRAAARGSPPRRVGCRRNLVSSAHAGRVVDGGRHGRGDRDDRRLAQALGAVRPPGERCSTKMVLISGVSIGVGMM